MLGQREILLVTFFICPVVFTHFTLGRRSFVITNNNNNKYHQHHRSMKSFQVPLSKHNRDVGALRNFLLTQIIKSRRNTIDNVTYDDTAQTSNKAKMSYINSSGNFKRRLEKHYYLQMVELMKLSKNKI